MSRVKSPASHTGDMRVVWALALVLALVQGTVLLENKVHRACKANKVLQANKEKMVQLGNKDLPVLKVQRVMQEKQATQVYKEPLAHGACKANKVLKVKEDYKGYRDCRVPLVLLEHKV